MNNTKQFDNLKWYKIPYQKKGCCEVMPWKADENYWHNNYIKDKKIDGATITGKLNNIFVIDLDDYKNDDKNIDAKNFCELFPKSHPIWNTYKVQTRSGGLHLYFKYNKYLINKTGKGLDIRNDGGIIYSADSHFYNKSIMTTKFGKYTLLNNVEPIDCPSDVLEYLNNCGFVYTEEAFIKAEERRIIKAQNKKKSKKNKNKNNKKSSIKYNNNIETYFKYMIPETELRKIFDTLPEEFWTVYCSGKDKESDEAKPSFLIWTTACKVLQCEELWDEYNEKKDKEFIEEAKKNKKPINPCYDYDKNLNIWDGCQPLEASVSILFKYSSYENVFKLYDLYRYQPIELNNIKPDEEINKKKLGYDFFNKKDNYICMADTGTGKTTSTVERLKNIEDDENVLIIGSRKTLCEKLYTDLLQVEKFKDDTYLYSDIGARNYDPYDCKAFIVQLESIKHFYNLDEEQFNDTVLFIDEFNSLIEHLIRSSTMNETRSYIYEKFIQILNGCKQIICVDADINDASIKFFERNKISKKLKFVKNNYLHNNNKKAKEINNDDEMYEMMEKTEYWICPCDGYGTAKALKRRFPDAEIITKDPSELKMNELDGIKRLIFSPKIIYGLDLSKFNYSVFCFFHTKSISPSQMVQMVCRARNIDYIYFYFENKKCQNSYVKYEDVANEIYTNNKYGQDYFKHNYFKKYEKAYLEMLIDYTYINRCFKTNPRRHFINVLIRRGVHIEDDCLISKNKNNHLDSMRKEAKEELYNKEFNLDNYKDINLILKIEPSDINEKETDTQEEMKQKQEIRKIFIQDKRRIQHYNICNYFLLNHHNINFELKDLTKVSDFIANKLKSDTTKMKFLDDVKMLSGDNDKLNINPTKGIKEHQKIFNLYKIIFGIKNSKADFSSAYGCKIVIASMYKKIFGDVFKSKTSNKKEQRNKKIYTFNEDYINTDIELLKIRNKDYKKNNKKYCNNYTSEEIEIITERKEEKYLQFDPVIYDKLSSKEAKKNIEEDLYDNEFNDLEVNIYTYTQEDTEKLKLPNNYKWKYDKTYKKYAYDYA